MKKPSPFTAVREDDSTLIKTIKNGSAAPQFRVYLVSNLALARDTSLPREVFAAQMLCMEEMLTLAARHPELAMKFLNDLRSARDDDTYNQLMDQQIDDLIHYDKEDDVAIAVYNYSQSDDGER